MEVLLVPINNEFGCFQTRIWTHLALQEAVTSMGQLSVARALHSHNGACIQSAAGRVFPSRRWLACTGDSFALDNKRSPIEIFVAIHLTFPNYSNSKPRNRKIPFIYLGLCLCHLFFFFIVHFSFSSPPFLLMLYLPVFCSIYDYHIFIVSFICIHSAVFCYRPILFYLFCCRFACRFLGLISHGDPQATADAAQGDSAKWWHAPLLPLLNATSTFPSDSFQFVWLPENLQPHRGPAVSSR